jgi:ABC-type transport system involved in cytochrome c biogenesis permease component
MLSIAIVLFIIVFPVLIPAAVSTVGAISDARKRRLGRVAITVGDYAESVAS